MENGKGLGWYQLGSVETSSSTTHKVHLQHDHSTKRLPLPKWGASVRVLLYLAVDLLPPHPATQTNRPVPTPTRPARVLHATACEAPRFEEIATAL